MSQKQIQIEVDDQFSIQKCQDNPDKLYIFGDNLLHSSEVFPGAGQAVIRGQRNTIGLSTLDAPHEFWSDTKFKHNQVSIDSDIYLITKLAEHYKTICFPKFGLGTGRAELQKRAPKTFLFLSQRLLDVFGYNNVEFLQSKQY